MSLYTLLLTALLTTIAKGATHPKRSITCLDLGTTATASWTNSAGQTCSFVGVVGSNYGSNGDGSGEYAHFPQFQVHSMGNNACANMMMKLLVQWALWRWVFWGCGWGCVYAGLFLA